MSELPRMWHPRFWVHCRCGGARAFPLPFRQQLRDGTEDGGAQIVRGAEEGRALLRRQFFTQLFDTRSRIVDKEDLDDIKLRMGVMTG